MWDFMAWKALTYAWCHLICKAFDLHGILSYTESEQSDPLVFEGEKSLFIVGIILPVGAEHLLYA